MKNDLLVCPNNIVVDGIWGSGKSLLTSLLQSLEGLQPWSFSTSLDRIGVLYGLGDLDRDAARLALRDILNESSYFKYIGRHENLRIADISCVLRTSNIFSALWRIFASDSSYDNYVKASPRLVNLYMTHLATFNNDLFENSFGTSLSVLNVMRSPAKCLDHWTSYFEFLDPDSPAELTPKITYNGLILPFVAAGWEREYLKSSSIQRAIVCIYKLYSELHGKLVAEQLPSYSIVPFDSLVCDPFGTIQVICDKLSLRYSQRILCQLVRKNKLPRISDSSGIKGFWSSRNYSSSLMSEMPSKALYSYLKDRAGSEYLLYLEKSEALYQSLSQLSLFP